MQVKPADSERFLAKADPKVRLLLLHGEDEGLIAERAARFARTVIGPDNDPFAHVQLDAGALAEDPSRLADEAHAVPMFGGRRCISVRLSGNSSIIAAIEPLVGTPPIDSWIVVTAGNLRKTSPIRRLFESAGNAAAIACFADADAALGRLIDEEVARAGLTATSEARKALVGLIGGDRMASRSEVAKLCLYVGTGQITIDDVRSIVGDASAFAVDEAIDAAALGDTDRFARLYRRLLAAGTSDFAVAGAALRHFQYLHRARALVDRGEHAGSVVGPPIFFARKQAVSRQIERWPSGRIERALDLLDKAIIDSRLHAAIADEIVGQAMIVIASLAGRPMAGGSAA